MLKKLTPEQKALIPVVRDEWTNRLDSCPQINREKTEAGIKWLYRFCKLKEPTIIFVSSPLGAQYAANVLAKVDKELTKPVGDSVGGSVRAFVWNPVGGSVWNSIGGYTSASVGDSVGASVGAYVGASVRTSVWTPVRDSVCNSVGRTVWGSVIDYAWDFAWDSVHDSVWNSVRNSVGGSVWDSVRDSVRDSVLASVRNSVWNSVGRAVRTSVWNSAGAPVRTSVRTFVRDSEGVPVRGSVKTNLQSQRLEAFDFAVYGSITDFGWVAWCDYFQRIGISLGKAEKDFNAFKNLLVSGLYDMIQLKGVCIVCEMPREIHRDSATRLHSTGGPSIRWADGFELYHLWGVSFEKELHAKVTSRAISAKDVLKIENMEQRMAALKSLGAESVIDALESNLIATSDRGNALYAVKGIGEQMNYCLKYKCPSTSREYVSFVPPEVGKANDPDAAMAWKFSITKEQYKRMSVET